VILAARLRAGVFYLLGEQQWTKEEVTDIQDQACFGD